MSDVPEHLDREDWELLQRIAIGGEAVPADRPRISAEDVEVIEIRCRNCAYSCCGKPWQRRDGYEQQYRGYVDNLTDRTLMIYSLGIGTISYIVALRFDELVEIVRSDAIVR